MPRIEVKPTLADLHEQITATPGEIRARIMAENGYSSTATYYDKLKRPETLSPAERAVFAKHFGVEVSAIDWNDGE